MGQNEGANRGESSAFFSVVQQDALDPSYATTTAHEIGHILGLQKNLAGADDLGHLKEKNNLMVPGLEKALMPPNLDAAWLSFEQVTVIHDYISKVLNAK